MGQVTFDEFILARIDEADKTLKVLQGMGVYEHNVKPFLEGIRFAVRLSQDWPILLSEPSEMQFNKTDLDDPNKLIVEMSQKLEWITRQEYLKRFGTEAPITPMLKMIAAHFQSHPDYNPEWGE